MDWQDALLPWQSVISRTRSIKRFLHIFGGKNNQFQDIFFPFFFSTTSSVSCSPLVTSEKFLLMPRKSKLKVLSVKPSVTNLKTQNNSLRPIFATDKNFGLWRNYTSPYTEKLVIIISLLVIPLQLHMSHMEKNDSQVNKANTGPQ